MVCFCHVPASELHLAWLKCVPHLESALEYSEGESGVEHFRRAIEAGRMHLFVGYDGESADVVAAMVTQFVTYSNFTSLRIVLIAGSSPNVLAMAEDAGFMASIVEWSKARGATKWEASCHPAMARLLQQKLGFRQKYTTVFLDV